MRERWRVPLVLSLGWLALGVAVGVLEGIATSHPDGFRPAYGPVLAGALWAPLTVAATGLARKVPWDAARRLRFLAVHGIAALSTSFVLNGAYFAVELLLGMVAADVVGIATVRTAIRYLHLNAGGYALVVAAVHLLDGRVRLTDRAEPLADADPVLLVPQGQGGLRLPHTEIDWIEADGDYARVHAGERTYLVSKRMKQLENELAHSPFLRVHRSAIVNAERVREVRHRSHGDFEAVLTDGTVVRVSRTRREALLALVGSDGVGAER